MTQKKTKSHLIISSIIIFGLLFFNLRLIKINDQLKDHLYTEKNYVTAPTLKNSEIYKIDELLNLYVSNKELNIVAIFPPEFCSSCLGYEVPNLNKIHSNFKDHLKVFHFGEDDYLFQRYGAEFEVNLLNNFDELIVDPVSLGGVVIYIVDSSGKVFQVYEGIVGNANMSDEFTLYVNRLLDIN